MKTLTYLTVGVVACVLTCGVSHAEPRPGSSIGKDYLITASDLGHWSFGLYTVLRDRMVEVGGFETGMKDRKIMGYVGFHAMPWGTLYGSYGSCSRDFDVGSSESEGEYGVGLHINILDHMFTDPYLIEDRIRLDGYVQYHLSTTGGGFFLDETLEERSASIVMSIISRPEADVSYWPRAVSLYVGAVYSDLESSALSESQTIGLTAGLEFFVSDSISVDLGIESFEEMGYRAGIHVNL